MRLRTVVIGVVVLFVALIATGVAILMSIDFNQYKGQIADAVKAATGRELTIAGNFKLGLSLTPSVSVDDVSFANAPGGSRPNMLTLKHLAVQMELLPLLSRQIKVDSLVLDGADILLETNAKGQGNWVFGTPAAASATTGSSTSAPAPASGGMALPQVSTVQIRNSIVTYRDGITGASHSFKVDKLDATTAEGKINIVLAAVLGAAPLNVTGDVGAPELLSGSVPYPLDLAVTSGNTTASIKGEVAQITKMQGINLQVSAKGNALSDLNGLAGVSLPPLGPYSFAGVVADASGGYKVSAMQLTMGGSSLTGDVSLALGGKRPKIAANLASTKIDLKDFGVKPAPAAGGSSGSSGGGSSDGRVFPATPLPFGALTTADADVNLLAQQMIKAPVTMDNVKLVLSLANGKLQVKPFSAGIAGGSLVMNLSVDGARMPAPISLDLVENQVEAGSLMEILAGSHVLSGGRVNLKTSVAGAGNSVRAIMAGLNGKFDAAMGPGNINNGFAKLMFADLFKMFSSGGDTSNLKCVVARYDISGGLANTRQLVVETSGVTIIGTGKINLATEGLDLHLVPHATSADLAALAIPMQVGGTMANPSVAPDAAAMATGTLNTVLTTPGNVLGTVGSIAGIGGSQQASNGANTGAGCGAAALAAQGSTSTQKKQGTTQSTGSGGLLGGVGNATKGATDALKGLLP